MNLHRGGAPPPVDPALAADGVDEAVRLMFASAPDGYTVVTAAERAADARLVATAVDLDLWLWSRSDEAPTVEADRALFDRFAEIVAAGIS